MIFCHGCGKEIHESAVTCPHCGAPQQTQKQTSSKSQNIALVLAALLGAFGAHRFYLGKIVSGVFYLLFCWTGIPGLIAFIECFMIAFASQQDWARKYNNGTLVPPVHIALKILMLIFPVVFILGIVAAVAIPAYQDYNTRSRVAHGIEFISPCKTGIDIYFEDKRLPTSLHDVGCLFTPLSGIKGTGIATGVNAVEVAVLFEGGKLDGKSVSFVAFNVSPGQRIEWRCVSATIPQKYLGPDCKEQLDWVTSVHAAEKEATQSTKPPAPAQQPQKEATVPEPYPAPTPAQPDPVPLPVAQPVEQPQQPVDQKTLEQQVEQQRQEQQRLEQQQLERQQKSNAQPSSATNQQTGEASPQNNGDTQKEMLKLLGDMIQKSKK